MELLKKGHEHEKKISKSLAHFIAFSNYDMGVLYYRKKDFESSLKCFKKTKTMSGYDFKQDMNLKLTRAIKQTKLKIK